MTNIKSTKRALITSIIAMFLCFAMLVGTTYAWFTSTVTSAGNIIQTGTLNVTLEYSKTKPVDENDANWLDASEGAIFNYKYWEPGYTDVKYIKVQNEGTLDLQYLLTVVPNDSTEVDVDLAEVIDVYMFEGAEPVIRDMLDDAHRVGTVADLMANPNGAVKGVLYAEQNADPANGKNNFDVYTVVLKMQETAGNEYQGLNLGGGFTVNLLATQYASESDAFDNTYDDGAKLPMVGTGSTPVGNPVLGRYTIKVVNANSTSSSEAKYIATLVINEESVADTAKNINVIVKEDEPQTQSSLGINVEGKVESFEVIVEGLVEGNTKPIEVRLYVGTGKNVGSVVYHTLADGSVEELPATYTADGFVIFETTSFSPFSVVVYDEPRDTTNDIPTCTLTELKGDDIPDYEWAYPGTALGDLLAVDPGFLDAYFSFKADQTQEEAAASKYAQWKCDFFVRVDGIETLPTQGIVLGGYYEDFNAAIAFTPNVEVAGGTWIPLLMSAGMGWEYQNIAAGVGEFICGVKDVDNNADGTGDLAAAGATFTVQLRIVDTECETPDNPAEGEYILINEVVYNFATGKVTITKTN